MRGRDSKRPEITAWTAKRFHHWPVDQSKLAPRLPGETQPGWSKHRLGWAGWLELVNEQEHEGFTNRTGRRVTQLLLVLRRTCTNSAPACSSFVPKYRGWVGRHGSLWWRWLLVPPHRWRSKHLSEWACGKSWHWIGVLAGTVAFRASATCILLFILIYSINSISSISSASSRSVILNLNPTLSQPRVWSLSLYFCL